MNQIDLSNQYDVLKNLDMTTQRCFIVHSNRASYDKSVLAFGVPEGDPTYWPDTAVGIRNNAGTMEFRHAGTGWQIMGSGGSGTGTDHQQNTDTGTDSISFILHNTTGVFDNPTLQECVLVMGSAMMGGTLFESAVGFRNNHGIMEFRNYNDDWTPVGSGGSLNHIQNTDVGTNSFFFTLNRDNLPFPVTLAFNEVPQGVDKAAWSIGIRNFHGTMEYRNDGGTWTPIGSAIAPPPPIDTIQFISRAEYIHPFLM